MTTKKQDRSKSPLGRAEYARGATSGAHRPKLNPKLQHEICGLLRLGVPVPIAVRAVGVSDGLWAAWRERAAKYDKDPEEHRNLVWYAILAREVEKARGQGAAMMHRVLRTGHQQTTADVNGNPVTFTPANGDLRWLLERCYRDEYGPQAPVERGGGDGAASTEDRRVTVNLVLKPDAEDDRSKPEPAADAGDPEAGSR